MLLLGAATPALARPSFCLPPVFDRGLRLHPLPAPKVYWLELLFRQHEICWRKPASPDELRVALVGNSAMYGFPLAVEDSFAYRMNDDFVRRGVPAHVFNLGFVTTYQVKDALIIREALEYEPDVILYPVTLAEFLHVAPIIWPGVNEFFQANRQGVRAMLVDPPPGLVEPFEAYAPIVDQQSRVHRDFVLLQEAGRLLRYAVAGNAERVTAALGEPLPPIFPRTGGRQRSYDCAKTESAFAAQHHDWEKWNILAYLEQIQRTRGIPVVIVNWPNAHEPVDTCYNVRYPADAIAHYNAWLRDEASRRGLRFVDLHALLTPDDFIDSLHVSAEGHAQIAARLEEVLTPMLVDLAEHRVRVAHDGEQSR